MNKMMKTVLCALCVVLGAWGATAAVKTVTWSLPADWESLLELDQICEPVGAPSVAYYNALIEVPSTATNFAITASQVAYRATDLPRPTPVLEPSIIGEALNAPVEDPALYASVYPNDTFEQGEPWEMNGKTVLPVRIKVYRWNGPDSRLEALTSITLTIDCTSPPKSLKLTTSGKASDTAAKYIVISPPGFMSAWQEFIDYRRTTHPNMTFALVSTADIYAEYSGKDDALKIHHFIEAMYAKGTRYVLLGAGINKNGYDANTQIPTRVVCIRGENTQYCDWWYCVMDYKGGQEVWDYNGDGIYLASKNSSGGYTADVTSKFTWQGKMMVHRFPARSTVTLNGKTKTGAQQISGYVAKLRRFEQGMFQGRFSQAILADTLDTNRDTSQGNTAVSCTMERQFYDLGANIFSEVHGKPIALNEYETRERGYSYFTLNRPVGYNRSVLQRYYSNGENANTFYGRNFDAMLINSHGSPDAVEPINRNGVFNATGLCGFYIMIVPCHAGNPSADGNNVVAISEASVINPDGGSLVCFANSSFGWYSSKDTYSQKVERDVVKSLYGCTGNGFQDAGTARLYGVNNYGTPSPANANGQVIADSMAYGDPLVSLSPIWSRTVQSDGNWYRNDLMSTPSQQEFATGLTINATAGDQTITITNAIGSANLTINGTSGQTLTLAASGNGKFKNTNKVTVKNGMTLNWGVPGGFGRNGIEFTNGGNLRLSAEGYYGIDFKGMTSIWVSPPSGKTAIVDFDSKGYFRNASGYFTNLSVEGLGETIFRSRQAGIFSTALSIPVTGGKLTLETPCIGGSGAQDATNPLFKLSNGATLSVRPNPNWTAECFSRSIWQSGGTIESSCDTFYFGPNGSSYPGLDIWINGDNNFFTGTYPIRLNGQLRLRAREGGGTITANCELANGAKAGSITLESGVTLKLAKSNSFSGGITVPDGARLVVDNAGGLGTGSVVVQSGGTLQMNAMPLTGVKSVTLQSGARLVLYSKDGASYQMYSPATTSFTIANGVKVYDSKDETKELDGIVTPEGAYLISDAAKFWGNVANAKWNTSSSMLAWSKKGVTENLPYANGDTVLFKDIDSVASATVPVEGALTPGMMVFQNANTAYKFTGSGASLTVGSLATAGTASFEPAIRATTQVSVGGKTTFGNVTTPTLNVAGGGALQVTGTVKGIDTIGSIRFTANATCGIPNWADKQSALQLSELQFFNESGTLIIFPVNTVIKDSVGNATTITGVSGSTYTFNNSNSLKNLFDGNCSTYHTVGNSKTGPWSITINLGAPIEMFKTFKYGRGQNFYINDQWARIMTGYNNYPYANPYGWNMAAGSNESSLKTVYTQGAQMDGNSSSLTGAFTPSASATSTSKATVQSGGTLYLNGTYNVPITINAGATLAVTNNSKLTFGAAKTIPTGTYAMTLDATQAQKSSNYFQVTSGGGFSSIWQVQTADDVAAKIDGGNLWIATQGVMPPPYARTITGNGSAVTWNTNEWKGKGDTSFTGAWGSVITKPSGSATLNVTGTNLTMNIDCAVNLDTLKVTTPTNCYPKTFTVNLASGGSAGISALDFRDFNGKAIWNPQLASWGTNIYVGTNDVTIASMTGGTGALQVGEGGKATVPQKFASYDIDISSYLRFTGAHNFSVDSDLPNKGIQSFNNTTLSGGFQKSAVTYLVENGDTLTFTGDANNYGARMSSSFDIRGGSVTINSNAASTWFGINGETSFRQTNGTFRCTANDTAMSAKNSGFLVGYSASSSDNFEFDISGGRFEIPNTYINFFGPVRFNLTSNGVVQAKGVFRGSNKGIITVNEGAAFELGTIGLVAGACDFNLYGGTLAGFENGAHTRSTVNLVGVGTLAAKANTTFTIDAGTINTDGATLNIGVAGGVGVEGYTGTVKLSEIPTGVTNITVSAGTWDMGELRPTNSILSRLDGKIAVELDDEELRTASTTGFEIIRLADGVTDVGDKVEVVRADGTVVPATGLAKDGKLYLHISYVYPLYGTVTTDGEWSNFGWHDVIGMPFTAQWTSDIDSIILSNTCENAVATTVPSDFNRAIHVYNSGDLTLNGSGTINTLNDAGSIGKTTLDLTANNVTVGAETVIKHVGSGNLTLVAGKCAALWNELNWPTASIIGFSGTAKIKYVGDTTLTSLKYTSDGAGYVSYAQKVAMSELAFANSLTRFFEDGADVTVTRFVMGNQKNTTGQTFRQADGKIVVTGTGNILDASPTDKAPLLFSHWEHPVTYYLTGGELIATNGINGSVYFGRDGVPKLYIGGGTTTATLRTNGLINRSDTKDKTGSVIELKPNGYLEIGNKNFVLYQNAELRLSGGTFLAYENAEILSNTSKFTLTANTTSYLSATNGATLTVSKVPTGTGTLICNPTSGSKVVLKGGSWNDVKLGGEFTIYLTSAQDSATSDTPLFTPASETMDLTKVTVRKSDGTEIAGVVRLYNGKASFVPDSGYAMPAKAVIDRNTNIWNMVWYDSSTPARSIDRNGIVKCSDVWFEAVSDATITVNTAKSLNSVRIFGDHSLSFARNGAKLTFTSTSIETDVTSASNAVVFTSANIAAGKTLSLAYGGDVGAVSGAGTLVISNGFPTAAVANDWTGYVKLTGMFPANKNIGALGNANSTIEFAGNMEDAPNGYFATPVDVNSPFVLSGTMKISNGNSNSIQVKFNKKFSGEGTFTTVDNSKPGKPDIFQVLGDASEFLGDITLNGAAHSITFGDHNYGYGGYLYVTADNGATIASGKQWIAANAINVDANGVLNLQPRTNDSYASTSTVNVSAGGYLNLLQTSPSQTVWPITSGTLTMNGGVMVNGVVIAKDKYTVATGTITLKANATGASVSINVIGGNKGKAGKSIGDNTYAGAVPVQGKNWNQGAAKSDNTAVNAPIANLKEVLPNGTVINGPMKATLVGACAYSADGKSTNPNGDGELMFGYLDDGQTSGNYGATITVENIPYTSYAVYIYMGTDVTGKTANSFGPITVISEGKTVIYPTSSANTAWGSADSTHGTVTLSNGGNYLMFSGFSGSTLTVKGYKNGTVSGARCGIAGIQIFNTGTRLNTLTWNGGATDGTWDKTSAKWSSSASASTTWAEVADGINTAKFNGDTSLTLGETVCPDVIDIASNAVTSAETGFITTTDMLVAENMKIADISSIYGEMWGNYVSSDGAATPCFFTKATDNQSATVQMQKKDGEVKCVKLTLTQNGDNIYARADYAKWVASTYDVGSVNFDGSSPAPNNGYVVTSDDGNGYGIKKLKLSIHSIGTLSVANAEKFGKAFTVNNGILTVAAGTLTQDVTLASGGKLNIISTDITNEYVMTSGKVIGGTMENLLFNGSPLESGSWTLDLTNGMLKRVVKPGTTPFTYTIAENGTTQWTNAPWVASNFFYVLPEEWTTNTVAEADLTVNSGITNTLVANANIALETFKISNSGVLGVDVGVGVGGGAYSLTATTVDNSTSSGTTVLNFAPTNVMAGVDTILSQSITGKLTVGSGNKATINGVAGFYDVSSGGEVRYVGDALITSVFSTADGAVLAYRNAELPMSNFWKLKLYDGDRVTATGSGYVNPIEVTGGELVLTNKATNGNLCLIYGGNSDNTKAHSSFSVTGGGKVTVLASGTGTANTNCGFLFGQTRNGDTTPSLTIDGGVFDVSGGHFTFWQKSTATVVNGMLKAKGIYKQDGNTSSLAVNAGGVVEIGSGGIDKNASQTLTITMNGGTLRASDTAEAKLPITLTSANTFSAAADKTLTVSGLLSGDGSVVIGEEDWTGTVKFSITNSFTGGVTLAYGTLEVPTGALKGNVTIGAGTTLNVTGTAGGTEYAITDGEILFGTGATMANIKLNGQVLPADEKWEIEGGKIKRRIITPPFHFIITQNGNWNEQTWYDANNIVLRDYEVAEEAAKKPSITLDVQNESSLFITNELDLTSLAATGQKVTLDFSQLDGNALAEHATFLHPSTNIFMKTTTAITGNYDKAAPSLPTGYTGEFIADATGLRYVITAPRKGYDYVGTLDYADNIGDVHFSTIAWEGGVTYTNDYQNTVTLKVRGDVYLYLDTVLDLYAFNLVAIDGEAKGYVTFMDSDTITVADATLGIRTFDFSGTDSTHSPVDFGSRISVMPECYFGYSSTYAGTLKDHYSFYGEDNEITSSDFAGSLVSVSESGTLTGAFAITAGGKVSVGGDYDGSAATFDIGAGELNISYGAVSIGSIGGTDATGRLVVFGGALTANVDGFQGAITNGAEDSYEACALHMTGTAAGPVYISADASLYLTRATQHQTEFQVTTGTLTFPTEAKLYINNELIETSRITVEGGKIIVADNVPTEPFTFTIATSGTYDWTDLAWRGANGVLVTPEYWEDAVGNVQLSSANGVTATINVDTNLTITAFALNGNADIVLAAAGSHLGTVSGTGTITCNFWPEDNSVATMGTDWTGTFKVAADANPKNNWDMTAYYNETSSTFNFAGTVSAGYFNKVQLVNYGALDLTGNITFNNGYSTADDKTKACQYIYTKLSGYGTFYFNKTGVTPIVWFKDVSTFSGTVQTLSTGYRLAIGAGDAELPQSAMPAGTLTVVGDTELTPSAKIIAPSGVLVTNATLTVNWGDNLKDSGTITVGGLGKLVVHDNTLSNNVTIATGGTLNLLIEFTEIANEFKITEGTLTNNGTILVNGKAIPNGWAVVGNKLIKQGLIFWIAQGNANWNDEGVWAYQDGTSATFQDGDVVNFTNAVASVTLTANVAPSAIVVASGANVTVNGNFTLGTPTITGAGTLAVNPGMNADRENFIPANCFADFTGTYHVKSGRIKYASAIAQAVTLKVTDGGQLWLSGGTWNNHFELSGQGWKKDKNNGMVEYAALRVDATIADAATINFMKVDDVVPSIGKVGDYSLGCTLTGCGFVKYGTGTLTLTAPSKWQIAAGTTTVAYGKMQLGNNNGSVATAYALGSAIEVASGATLKVKIGTSGAPSHAANQYYWLNSDVILNGGTLTSDDGGYKFKKIDVWANSEVKLGWNKRHTIDYLSGSANLTLYRTSSGYGQAQFIISDGDYSGVLTVGGDDDNHFTELIPHGTALAEVSSITFGNGKLVMNGEATIGNIGTCAKPISGTGTLTLKGGTVSGVISGAMGVCIAGEVTLSGNNTYTGATTIDADGVLTRNIPSGVTESFTGGISGTGTLVIKGSGTADLTGKPLADGTVRIVGGNMALTSATQGDITLGANGHINLTSEESPMTGITITSGDFFMVDGASFANISTNGVALTEPQNWSIVGGKIKYTSPSYEVISINIAGGRNGSGESPSDYLVTGDAKVGLEQVPGNIWNNVSKRWASDASDKSAIAMTSKAYNGTVEVTRNTVKVTANANNTYGWGDATTAFFKGYLDDGGDRAQIAVEGIPYTYYDVIVYCTSDSGGYMLNAVTVGGTEYTWDDTAKKTVAGSDKWGAAQASTPEYGKNALRIEGLTGTTLAIKGGANANTARGGLAAIQIVNRGSTILNKRGFMATIAANGTLSEQTWEPEKLSSGVWHEATVTQDVATASTALTIDKDYTLEALKLVNAAGQELVLDKVAGVNPSIAAYDFTGAAGLVELGFVPTVPVKLGAQLGIPNGLFTGAYSVETSTFVGGASSEFVFDLGAGNTQEITGTATDANKLYGLTVTSGTLRFTKGGDNTTFRGRTVTADGENAVINLAVGDCTGYSNGGTKMVVKNGGTILVSSRDTCKTPIDFAGGTLVLASGCATGGRAFDLYGNNNWNVTADSAVVAEGSGDNAKIAIRDSNFTITVAENARFDFGAAVSKNNGYGGTEGKLVKAGVGELVLKAAGDYQNGTDINAGTLTIENASALGTGAVTLAGGATLKVKSDTASISGLTLASGAQLTVKTKTDIETIIVSGASASIDLTGVVIDADTFTDDPIPEDTVAYRILSAANINNADKAVCGAGLKGSWTFDVEGEAGTKQTLIARKTKKGFSFTIAEVEVEEVQTTVAVHDTESKNAIDIDRDWVAEKAELTEAEKQNDETVAVAINTIGENGAKLYESYVLGLDPNDATSKPVVAPVQTADPEKVTFKVANIAVNKSAGANNVTYKVYSGDTPGEKDKLETEKPIKATEAVGVELPTSGVKYYTIEVLVN